jgi:hypothetical protein
MATPAKSKIPVAAKPAMLATKPAVKSAPGTQPEKKDDKKDKKKKRKAYLVDSVYGYRAIITRRAVRRAANFERPSTRVSKKFLEFADHFLRSKTVDLVRSADTIAKLQARKRIGPSQVAAAIKSVFRSFGEEFTADGTYEPQMVASAMRAVADYEKALDAKRKQVEAKGPHEVVAKLRAIHKGHFKGFNVPFAAAKRILPKEAAQFAAKNPALAQAMETSEAHEVKPSVTLSWKRASAAADLFVDALRIFNLASEVCSDSVSFTKTGTMALAGAVNYLLQDIVSNAVGFMPAGATTLLYAHLEHSLVEISRKKGVVMVDSDAFKLMEPYLMRTPYMRSFAVGHSEPAWDYVLDLFPYELTKTKKAKSKKAAKAEAEAAAAAAAAGEAPVVLVAPAAKKARKSAPAVATA